MEDPLLKRYNREPYIAVQGDFVDGVQPPDVTAQILLKLEKLKPALPAGYRIETGGSVEESMKSDTALGLLFPPIILLMLIFIMLLVCSFATMFMVFATAPLGLVGTVPTPLICQQPFGFNAILGLIGLEDGSSNDQAGRLSRGTCTPGRGLDHHRARLSVQQEY